MLSLWAESATKGFGVADSVVLQFWNYSYSLLAIGESLELG